MYRVFNTILLLVIVCSLSVTSAQAVSINLPSLNFDKVTLPMKPVNCFVSGCSNELCVSSVSPSMDTICLHKKDYTCLSHSKCEQQSNGQCGWSHTPQTLACQSGSTDTPSPTATPTLKPTPTPTPTNYTLKQRKQTRTRTRFEQSFQSETDLDQSDDQGEVSQTFNPDSSTTSSSTQNSTQSQSPLNKLNNLLRELGSKILFPTL